MNLQQLLLNARHGRAGGARIEGVASDTGAAQRMGRDLPVEVALPSLGGATAWLNTPPLSAAGLRGNVVLVQFWTYSCIN